ncbi:MAG TPA: NADP-dependent malic enzyme [Candidatus Saccharimonadales bacterium]|nr:NADP-dependent malic enzyme [Candidatus Saccharimonadales bacterium]
MDIYEQAIELHRKFRGKITTSLRDDQLDKQKLSLYYSPGVAGASRRIAEKPEELRELTWTNNLVAIISDGSAVLGLGNIGPKAAMPVMEGKALLFKKFANIDAVPIVLDVHTADEIVATVKAMAPSFGGINLEDIAAPLCFEVEERLKAELDIPIMHDDQHGTAVVTLAGLINAAKVVGKDIKDMKIAIVGAGAAGVAIAKLLTKYAQPNLMMVDSKGVISRDRTDLNDSKKALLEFTNPNNTSGSLADAVRDADVFVGVSQPDLLTPEMVATMADQPIVFALANPDPEIKPEVAREAGVAILATGRSDYPNQVNNAVAFPGIFRGALDNTISKITDEHKVAAAEAIAALVEQPAADNIIPNVFDERLVPAIADVIR